MFCKLLSSTGTVFHSGAFRALLLAGFLGIATLAIARTEHGWTADVGGGVTPLVGDISHRLDNGWNFRVGGGYNFTDHLSTSLQFSYNGLGVGQRVLNEAKVPDGNAHVWSFTAVPRISLSPHHGIGPYLIGAVGYYRRTVEFTRPTLQPVVLFDPFFGFLQGAIPADRVLGRITRNGIGGGGGLGFDIPLGHHARKAKLFTEARFEYAATGAMPTRMVPVTFGIRW
jgi:Outer membrane protein beta-barrel domain